MGIGVHLYPQSALKKKPLEKGAVWVPVPVWNLWRREELTEGPLGYTISSFNKYLQGSHWLQMLRGGKEKCLELVEMKRPFHCCAPRAHPPVSSTGFNPLPGVCQKPQAGKGFYPKMLKFRSSQPF